VPVLWDGPAPAPSLKAFLNAYCVSEPEIHAGTDSASVALLIASASGIQIRFGGELMLYWALVFLVVALIAGVLGFTGIAVASAGVAKILFIVFLVLFLVSLVTHFGRGSAAR
jgi:uncharacterized membrane protein YtjA (UPF0391 family)